MQITPVRSTLFPVIASLFLLGTAGALAQYNQATTGIYASGAGTNFVDSSATAAPNDLLTFSNTVYELYAVDLSGTFHFPATIANGTTEFRGTYGVNNSKRLIITSDRPMQAFGPPGGSFWTISGNPNGYGLANNSDASSFNLAIGPINDSATDTNMPSETVIQIGFVICSRTHATYPADIKATVSYSDGTAEAVTSTINNPRTSDDTFYGFTAPDGAAITNIFFEAFDDGTTTPVATRIGIDDIGFVTSSTLPRPPVITSTYPESGAVHWASNGLTFTVTSLTDIEPNGVFLFLNSNNVSSQLVVTGDPTNRTVTYSGLAPNTFYRVDLAVSNVAGGIVYEDGFFYTPETSLVTLFDSGGFADDTLYPVGYLNPVTNDYSRWVPAASPNSAEIVDLADGQYGKVLRRQQLGADYTDYLLFPLVSSGVVHIKFDARVSSMEGRTIDMSLNSVTGAGGGTQGPFIMWGTNALNHYDGTQWVPVQSLDTSWHSFELICYVSGSLAGTFDLEVDNTAVQEGLVWRNVFSPVGTLRVGAIRGSVIEFGELDNLRLQVGAEPLVALPVTLLSPVRSGADFSFSFQTLAGISYEVEYRNDVATGSWTLLETVAGDGTEKTVTHANVPAGPLFYRVRSFIP